MIIRQVLVQISVHPKRDDDHDIVLLTQVQEVAVLLVQVPGVDSNGVEGFADFLQGFRVVGPTRRASSVPGEAAENGRRRIEVRGRLGSPSVDRGRVCKGGPLKRAKWPKRCARCAHGASAPAHPQFILFSFVIGGAIKCVDNVSRSDPTKPLPPSIGIQGSSRGRGGGGGWGAPAPQNSCDSGLVVQKYSRKAWDIVNNGVL